MRGDARDGGYYYGATNAGKARNNVADAPARLPHGGANFAAGSYANALGGYNPGVHRVAGSLGYPNDGRGRMQYAGAITPVSAESRPVPRPPAKCAQLRTGSIRADVARYNEERGASRAMQRQEDDPRQREGIRRTVTGGTAFSPHGTQRLAIYRTCFASPNAQGLHNNARASPDASSGPHPLALPSLPSRSSNAASAASAAFAVIRTAFRLIQASAASVTSPQPPHLPRFRSNPLCRL